jgi:hypothetical protein
VAPKRAHTRANPEGPLTTSVLDLEKIISKGKALKRQASESASAIDSGIPTDTYPSISKKSLVESPAETQNSQEIRNSSQVSKVEEPSFSSNITDSILEVDISSHPKELNTESSPQKEDSFSSPFDSSPSKPSKGVLHTYTNLPVLEEILHDLSSNGEENLALLLGQFYKASYFPPISEPSAQDEVRQPFYSNSGNSCPPSSPTSSPPLSPTSSSFVSITKTAMASPLTRMEQILANRYAPLFFPKPLSAMPTGDYQKYMPKFTGAGEYTAEEHIEAFYAYAENINISEEDVWTRVFVQILDGRAQKWFKELPANSITGIEQLDEVFLKHWGERRDLLYYISEFGNLKRGDGESVSDFIKRFNKMFGKIPTEIKPSDASTKITFSVAFDAEFCLILRERRSATLALMQDVALEVESNITASQKLKGRAEKKKDVVEPSSSSNSKMENMAKMLESLTSEMSKLKVQNQQLARAKEPNTFTPRNPNAFPYRRNNPQVQILQRDRNPVDEQRIRPPLQNAVLDEEQQPSPDEIEDADEINCFGDENESSFLTQVDYEEALMDQQIQEASVEGAVYLTDDQKGYNLRSKSVGPKTPISAPVKNKKDTAPVKSKEVAANQPPAPEKQNPPPAKQQKKQTQLPVKEQVSLKAPSNEVKVSDRPSLSFNFESEI